MVIQESVDILSLTSEQLLTHCTRILQNNLENQTNRTKHWNKLIDGCLDLLEFAIIRGLSVLICFFFTKKGEGN